jgi:hypothetical protein
MNCLLRSASRCVKDTYIAGCTPRSLFGQRHGRETIPQRGFGLVSVATASSIFTILAPGQALSDTERDA